MNTSLTDALLACLPAQAYDRQALTVQREMAATSAEMDVALVSADALVDEQQPDKAALAFADWERNYGLPDACIGGSAATQLQRSNNLLARIKAKGNLSRAYMIGIAADLGYLGCTITEMGGTTCVDPCDSPVSGAEFIGVWILNVPVATAVIELACDQPCDQPLRSWGNTQLECSINRRKPAHTRALFAYAP
jgi:uncharacterized protein YmfQ (DUF2313 family)